jgi:hypothetical protein
MCEQQILKAIISLHAREEKMNGVLSISRIAFELISQEEYLFSGAAKIFDRGLFMSFLLLEINGKESFSLNAMIVTVLSSKFDDMFAAVLGLHLLFALDGGGKFELRVYYLQLDLISCFVALFFELRAPELF